MILAEPNEERFSKEYYREEDYDRLLNEAAKELQIVTTEKPRVHSSTRAYIAKEIRSLGFLLPSVAGAEPVRALPDTEHASSNVKS